MKPGLMILGYLLIIQEIDLCNYLIPLVGDQTGAYVRVGNTVSSGNFMKLGLMILGYLLIIQEIDLTLSRWSETRRGRAFVWETLSA